MNCVFPKREATGRRSSHTQVSLGLNGGAILRNILVARVLDSEPEPSERARPTPTTKTEPASAVGRNGNRLPSNAEDLSFVSFLAKHARERKVNARNGGHCRPSNTRAREPDESVLWFLLAKTVAAVLMLLPEEAGSCVAGSATTNKRILFALTLRLWSFCLFYKQPYSTWPAGVTLLAAFSSLSSTF
jgi:hypothetical protein